jgi:hypothetical protein
MGAEFERVTAPKSRCSSGFRGRACEEFQAGNLTLGVMQNDAFGATFAPNSMPIALRVADVRQRVNA